MEPFQPAQVEAGGQPTPGRYSGFQGLYPLSMPPHRRVAGGVTALQGGPRNRVRRPGGPTSPLSPLGRLRGELVTFHIWAACGI